MRACTETRLFLAIVLRSLLLSGSLEEAKENREEEDEEDVEVEGPSMKAEQAGARTSSSSFTAAIAGKISGRKWEEHTVVGGGVEGEVCGGVAVTEPAPITCERLVTECRAQLWLNSVAAHRTVEAWSPTKLHQEAVELFQGTCEAARTS
eukprot:28412-Hanusia_phi.AAC.10